MLESLDPRINRWHIEDAESGMAPKEAKDQLETYQVFLQMKPNKPYNHVGIVHAAGLEMAFLFAKEQFSRRYTCTGLMVVKTADVQKSPTTEGGQNVYDQITDAGDAHGNAEAYEVFHLYKRGKQHVHMGSVEAHAHNEALVHAKPLFNDPKKPVLNIWVVRKQDMMFTDEAFSDIWDTLPEKQYRDAIAYKAGDKLKQFKAQGAAS